MGNPETQEENKLPHNEFTLPFDSAKHFETKLGQIQREFQEKKDLLTKQQKLYDETFGGLKSQFVEAKRTFIDPDGEHSDGRKSINVSTKMYSGAGDLNHIREGNAIVEGAVENFTSELFQKGYLVNIASDHESYYYTITVECP